ncbi:MAG: division/cell wall cluster transcriptional repressor MraZ [Candidatus Magasanikbacteria bacterium]|nr:division/cell wall cluster transcriptional repressor MraZ [Candidatus Magasanikbacteria bacterium]
MFIGEYRHSIDDKGRLAIPAKFRTSLKKAVITRGLDACLFVYPLAEWKELATKLSNLPISQANSRAFVRLMLAGAMDVEVDAQGRVVVPDYLRTYAGLGKNVVVAGLYNRVELWNEDAWARYTKRAEKDSGEIAEQMLSLGV